MDIVGNGTLRRIPVWNTYNRMKIHCHRCCGVWACSKPKGLPKWIGFSLKQRALVKMILKPEIDWKWRNGGKWSCWCNECGALGIMFECHVIFHNTLRVLSACLDAHLPWTQWVYTLFMFLLWRTKQKAKPFF